MTRSRAFAASVLATLVLLSGCTPGADDPAARRTDHSASAPTSPGSSATPAVPPPAPERGACYRLRFGQLTQPSNASRPVPCSGRHDAQTIHVGRLDTVVAGHAVSVDADRVVRQLSEECPRRFAEHVGGTAQERDLTRL